MGLKTQQLVVVQPQQDLDLFHGQHCRKLFTISGCRPSPDPVVYLGFIPRTANGGGEAAGKSSNRLTVCLRLSSTKARQVGMS